MRTAVWLPLLIPWLCPVSAELAQTPVPVWIDTDPAIGEPERDVDDGFALIQAFHSPELAIRGVSVVFGNAPLDRGLPIARQLARESGPAGLEVPAGAAGADALGAPTAASPHGFECETLPVQIQTLPDDVTEPGVQGTKVETKPYLLVSSDFRDPPARVHYCSKAPDDFKRDLLDRLVR